MPTAGSRASGPPVWISWESVFLGTWGGGALNSRTTRPLETRTLGLREEAADSQDSRSQGAGSWGPPLPVLVGSPCAPRHTPPPCSPPRSQGRQPLQVCAVEVLDGPWPVLCGENIPGSCLGDPGLLERGPSGTRVSRAAPPPPCLGDEWAEDVIFSSLSPPLSSPHLLPIPARSHHLGREGALWKGGVASTRVPCTPRGTPGRGVSRGSYPLLRLPA